ncbi:MAG: SDR family NAD(P)-dependent oxidoreductase, partial [Chitinophagaceae bacterium]
MTRKIALITGASKGLGKSMALHLAERQVDIIFTYHTNVTEAENTSKEIKKRGGKAVAIQLDTGKIDTFEAFDLTVKTVLAEHWNRADFDFLINNAGIGINVPFAETTQEQFDTLMNVQFKGVFFLTQKLLPIIKKNGGRILNVSSGLARFTNPGFSAYAAMKGAIETLTRYLAKELGAAGITVNTIAPGAIATDFGGGAVRDDEKLNTLTASVTA